MYSFLKIGFSATLMFSVATSVFAQDTNAPRTLKPRTLNPVQLQAPTEQTPGVTPLETKTLSGGINVQSLDSVSTEALGVLSGKEAFPSTMWMGTSRAFAEQLIINLPDQPGTPYLRILQRRLLLSAAEPPKGTSGEKSLLTLRADKLAQMGQLDDVVALLKNAPLSERTADLIKVEAESHLLNDDTAKACALAATNIQKSSDSFWTKTLAFCRMLAKQEDQARLSLSLLQELGDEDPLYYNLMEALAASEQGKISDLGTPNALHLALIKATKASLPIETKQTQDPNLLRLLVQNGDLTAIQRAVEYNLASVDFLKNAYLGVEFSPEEQADALAAAENMDASEAQALLYQVSSKTDQLTIVRSEAIAMALELSRNEGNIFSVARLYQPLIANLPNSGDLIWFAPHAMRALLAAGDWENAKNWYMSLRKAAFSDRDAAQKWTSLRPLAAFAGFDVSADAVAQALNAWWSAQPEHPQSFAKANTLFAITDGLGFNIPDNLWLAMINGPKMAKGDVPKSAVRIKMNKAAMSSHIGETVLTALNGLNAGKLSKLDSNFLRDSLFALRIAGLENDARAIAVEAALIADF